MISIDDFFGCSGENEQAGLRLRVRVPSRQKPKAFFYLDKIGN